MSSKPKDPKGSVSFEHVPDALDQLALEDRIEALERQKEEVGKQTFLIPGRQKKILTEIDSSLTRLHWQHLSAKEIVAANPHQTEVLAIERKRRKLAKEKEAAEDGGREGFKPDGGRSKMKPG